MDDVIQMTCRAEKSYSFSAWTRDEQGSGGGGFRKLGFGTKSGWCQWDTWQHNYLPWQRPSYRHKVRVVYNRGKVLLPWVTAPLSSLLHSFPVWQCESKVSLSAEWSCAAFRPLRTWLAVCLLAWEEGRQSVCVGKSDSVYSGAVWMVSAELGWMGSHCLLCLYTKKLFCFSKKQLSFSQKAREHRQPRRCLEGCSPTHTHSYILRLEPVSVTFV